MNFKELLRHKPGEVRKITAHGNELIKALRSLRLKKHRQESGLFLAEGGRTLIEAQELGHRPLCLVVLAGAQKDPAVQHILEEAGKHDALVVEVSQSILDKISERENPQTVIGLFRQSWRDLVELDKNTARILALEDIRDPGNLGTILRTCDGFGVHDIALVGECTDPFGIEAVRASMGSVFASRIYRSSREAFEKWLLSYRGKVIGTSLEGAINIRKADFALPHLIVMGNEQKGLSGQLKGRCTQLVKIPMQGRADSFNLAVATGITLYLSTSFE